MAGFDQKTGHVIRDKQGRVTPPPHVTPAPEATPQEREQQVREIVAHRTAVVQHQSVTAERGSTAPPPAGREAGLPLDPVSATLPMSSRSATMRAAAMTKASAATAQRQMQQGLEDQHAAAQELVKRANPDYNPEQARLFDRSHGGNPAVHEKDATTLLLNSIGYTGNGVQDFNQQVARINKAFEDAYGQPPTPGLLLDLVRSPSASDPQALKNLFAGKPATSLLPDEAAMLFHTGQGPSAAAQLGKQKGLAAALRATVYGNNPAPLIDTASKLFEAKNEDDLVHNYVSGEAQAQIQMASMIPGTIPMLGAVKQMNQRLAQYGYTPADFAGRDWAQNERILQAAIGGSPAATATARQGAGQATPNVSALKAGQLISDWQRQMNQKYNLGLTVSGVIDDSWAKAVITLSHTKGYAAQNLAQSASNAGFGSSFDSFNAFNSNGTFANNSDGRAAKEATQQYVNAQHGQSSFLKSVPLAGQFGAAMPLQWFNNGGFSVSTGLDWVFGGGSSKGFGFQWNPLDLVSQNMSIPESALFRGGLSTFDALNGGWQQAKTDAYAGEAFGFDPSNWTGSDYHDAAKRLTKPATWLDIFGEQKLAAEHPDLDMVSNMIGDVVIARKWGSVGETMDGSDFARGMNDANQFHDVSYVKALINRSAYAKERVGNAFGLGKQGKVGEAAEQLAGQNGSSGNMLASEAYYGKNWVVDETDGNQWGDQFKLADGRRLRPLTRSEEEAIAGRGISRAREHEHFANATPEEAIRNLGERQWAAISGELKGMTQDEKDAAHAELLSRVEGMGLRPIETQGAYGGDPERSLFVPGLTQSEAMQLGRDFNQESVLTPKGMVFTTGEDAGKFHPTLTHEPKPNEKDFMSTTEFGGEPTQWASKLDFDQLLPVDAQFMKDKEFGELAQSGLPQSAELYRWHDLIHDNLIDEATHNNIAAYETVARNRILDAWKSPGVPARSTKFIQPMQRFWLKGRGPIPTFHPFAPMRASVWSHTSNLFDWADRTLGQSRIPGDTFLDRVARNLRTGFTKAPNPHPVPLIGADPRNIFRMAMNAGIRSEKGTKVVIDAATSAKTGLEAGEHALPSSKALEKMFIEGHVDKNPALILKVENSIKLAAAAQGRTGAMGDADLAFSAYADQVGDAPYLMTQRDELEKLLKEHMANKPAPTVPESQEVADAGTRSERVAEEVKRQIDEGEVVPNDGTEIPPEMRPSGRLRDTLEQTYTDDKGDVYVQRDGQFVLHQTRDDVLRQRDEAMGGRPKILGGEGTAAERGEENVDAVATNQEDEMAAWQARHEELTRMLVNAKGKSGPLFESEQLSKTGVPQLLLPKDNAVGTLNNTLKRISLWEREGLLVPDVALFWKHGITDSLRRLIAEGPMRAITGPSARRWLNGRLAEMPDLKAEFDTTRTFTKDGEWRYDMQGSQRQGEGPAAAFMSQDHPRAAAEYIDRRLMSGAYQTYKVRGKEGVIKWFLDTPQGQSVAEAEGMAGENSWILAHMVAKNIDNIEFHAPGFLEQAEQVRNGAADSRKALTKFIKKSEAQFPVSGHLSNDQLFNLAHPVRALDNVSQKIIGTYLMANKWNRGGLFHDMTAHLARQYVKAGGDEVDSIRAAMSQARVINRYHMLDLADALKVEQNIRWGALFFTKHRLYWNWLLQTMRARPQLALAAKDLQQAADQYQGKNVGSTPGVFTFNVPWRVPGLIPPGVASSLDAKGMEIGIPYARLLWLTEASNNPGPLSNVVHDIGAGDAKDLLPFRGNVSATTIDSAINTAYLMINHDLGRIQTSAGVLKSMSSQDQVTFQGIMARVQAGYYAQHHRYLDDSDATSIALKHMLITSFWRSSAFSGSYPNDPRLTNAQDAAWKAYNESPNPAEREKIRKANPWIDTLLGAYNGSPAQHTQEQQLWDTFNQLNAQHDHNLSQLLHGAKTDPNKTASDLFGKAWHAEQDRYTKAINGLEASARRQGATSWLQSFQADHFAQVHKLFSASLHQIYGIPEKRAEKVAEAGRPHWLQSYRAMLYGPDAPLGDAAIAKLPVDQQQTARETAAIYKQMIRPWNGEPTTAADKVRNAYFTQVYTPFVNARDKYFQRAGLETKDQAGRVYDELRAYYDSVDHPVTVNGIEMPSPMRVHFAMLPPAAQKQYTQGLMTKQWQWLSAFDKSLLGVKVDPSIQDGWTYYNNTLYEAIGGPAGTIHKAGLHPSLTPQAALQYAYDVDKGGFAGNEKGYPGFYADYVRNLQPVYARLAGQKIGSTPQAQQTWQSFLGRVSQLADWMSGGPQKPNPVYTALRDQNLNKPIVTDLLNTGRGANPGQPAPFGGLPIARPPDQEYPQGGYLYQLAMAQPNQQFRKEFSTWVQSNPDFMAQLFSTGE